MSDIRKLGFWETMCKIYHDQYLGSGMVVQIARLRGPLDETLLRDGLCWLQRRHPFLQADIVEMDDAYFRFDFQRYRGIEAAQQAQHLPLVITPRESDEQWREIAETEMNRGMADEDPFLWRVHALLDGDGQHHELVAVVHHSIADALSTTRMIDDLMAWCFGTLENRAPGEVVLPLFPAVEEMINKYAHTSEQAQLLGGEQDQKLPDYIPFQGEAPTTARKTRNLYLNLDRDLMQRLRARCKAQGCSVNDAISAALLMATYQEVNKPCRGTLAPAVNLRKYCDEFLGNEHFGCYVMLTPTTHDLSEGESIWEVALANRKALLGVIAEKEKIGFMPTEFDRRPLTETMISDLTTSNREKRFPVGPAISNIGALPFASSHGPFHIDALYFSTTQMAGNFPIILNLLSLHGTLCCCFFYTEPLLERARAEEIIETFQQHLKKAAE